MAARAPVTLSIIHGNHDGSHRPRSIPLARSAPRSARGTPLSRSTSGASPRIARWRVHAEPNPLIQGWLDLSSIVTAGAKTQSGNELAEKLGDEVYADINGWHLYLKDMKLANVVAFEVSNRIADGMDVEEAMTSTLSRVPVKLGKKKDVALLELVPSMVVGDAVKIVKDIMDDAW